MKATRQSIASSAVHSRQPRAVAPSGALALNRRIGNARLQRSLGTQILQRSPNVYDTNCEALTQKQCTFQSCGFGGSGKCRWMGPVRKCKCIGSGPWVPPPLPVPVPEKKPLPLRVRWHPDFGEYAQRLPYMEGLPGRELIVVMEGGLFAQALAIAGQRRMENLKRIMRVDPRNAPFIQVQPVLIGGALVAGAVSAVALAYIAGPALVAMVEAAVVAEASAAAVTAASAGAAASAGWSFGTVTAAAAAGFAAYLIAGGMSQAEAAAAVKPLVGKRLLAVADVAERPELSKSEAGQAVNIDGQAYNAILRLYTPA